MVRTEPYVTTLMQHGLMALGHPLPRFGADGDWGQESQTAYEAYLASLGGVPNPAPPASAPVAWPTDDLEDLIAFYGRPDLGAGRAPRSVAMELPYPMQLAWGDRPWTTRVYAHELVHDSLQRVLSRILERFGADGVRKHGLDQLGGVTNVRYMRGSKRRISRHSFGIAIDIDPGRNGLKTPWPSKAKMPREAVECFEEEGWTSFGRVRGLDAMHFQATSNYVGN